MDYAYILYKQIINPILKNRKTGTDQSIKFMDKYNLQRDDFDLIENFCKFSKQTDKLKTADKTALPKKFNKTHSKISVIKNLSLDNENIDQSSINDNDIQK